MTPTLKGRIQTRIALFLLIGLPVGLGFGLGMQRVTLAFALLGFALLIGLLLDPFYAYLQARRWDGDWPPLLMLIAGCLEGSILWLIVEAIAAWQIQPFSPFFAISARLFWLMYSTIWFVMFITNLGLLHIFFPYRRFKGGRLWD